MRGGLLLNDKLDTIKTIGDGINLFKNKKYSTFTLLTNSSIACITFKATLKPGVISPFIEIRSNIFGKSVNSLLFKYFPINNSSGLSDVFDTPFYRGSRKYIELTTESQIINEYLLQLKIYQKTYNTISSAYEPVCPYPIHYETKLSKNDTIDKIINILEDTPYKQAINYDIIDTLGYESDIHSPEEIKRRNVISKLGCIIMEFIDDYVPLSYIYQTISSKEKNKIKSFIAYELARLHHIGVIHGDLHNGNIMYNPNYKYITDGSNKKDLGRVLLIDFGRSKDNMELHTQYMSKKYGKYNEIGDVNLINFKVSKFKLIKPYTFEYIYSKRLELTLNFRKIIINKTITDINKFIKDNPTNIAISNLQKFKNSDFFKLANSVLDIKPLYPTNFLKENNVFNNDEFNYPFNKKKQYIYKRLNSSKKLKKDKIKNKIPMEFYPHIDLGNVFKIPKMNSIKMNSIKKNSIKMNSIKMNSNHKKTKANQLEQISQIAFNTLDKLKKMATGMVSGVFTRKKIIAIRGGKKTIYHYLQHQVLANNLQNNITKQLKSLNSRKIK